MSKWFYFNGLLLITACIQVFISTTGRGMHLQIIIGFTGLLFFLFNWMRQAIFSTIRNTKKRQTKIRLAQISKKIVPFHRWTGTTALILIIFHALLVIGRYGFQPTWPKMIVGSLAGLVLLSMVASGWLRLWKPSAKKRFIHIYIGMTLFLFIFIHILL